MEHGMILVTLSSFTPFWSIVNVCWKIIVSISLGYAFPPKQKFPRLYTIFLPLYSSIPCRTCGWWPQTRSAPHQLPDVQVFSGFHPELPLFISPVKDNNDQLCTILFYFGNILFQLFFPAKMIIQLIDSYQPYFDTLYFCNSSLIIAKMKDIRCIQSLQCIIETFLTIVMAVIICCINSFYRACCKYICVGSGCLKANCLSSRSVDSVRVPSKFAIVRSSLEKILLHLP